MAKVKTWETKADVLKDIAEATGAVPKNDDIAAQYIVVGDAPPPPRLMEDEDPEMSLMFGESYRRLSQSENTGPDLAGIRQMLDMMRNLDADDDDEDADGIGYQRNYEITISKIKADRVLNPNVPEFVPKGVNIKSSNVNGAKSASPAGKTSEPKRDSGSSNNATVETGTQATSYEDITTALKNTISEAAKSDSQSFHLKKQKNVAIATLLRLYASNDAAAKPEVKLWTPEQFEGKNDASSDVKIKESNATAKVEASPTPTAPARSPESSDISPGLEQDPEVRESIEKVNRWLEAPVQKKTPIPLCLGPISFKRKDPVVKTTTSSQPSTPPKQESQSIASKKYKPTKFAADLEKHFLERIQQKQKSDELNVNWGNLSDVLQKRDLVAKQRLEQALSPRTSNADS